MMEINNQRIIIFEGPDDTGKSDIAKALSKLIGVPYFKNKIEDSIFEDGNSDNAIYSGLYMTQFLVDTGYDIILDRFHASEFVYSEVYNRETDADSIVDMDEDLGNLNTTIVYCYKDNLEDYSDHLVDKETIKEIKDKYHLFFQITDCNVLLLQTDSENLEWQIAHITDFLRRAKLNKWHGNEDNLIEHIKF